jgi:hypothetical protein
MLVASCRTTVAVFMVFALLELAFLLLTIGAFGYVSPPLLSPSSSLSSLPTHSYLFFRNKANATKAGGWVGILTAIAAWYASAAFVINNTWYFPRFSQITSSLFCILPSYDPLVFFPLMTLANLIYRQATVLPVGEFIKAAPISEGPSEKKQEVPTPVVGYPVA